MRLLRLEVKGFKSFANETVLHFSEDVIGVVGPNGAGKSNVVDAIRWVLGEQKSKELRLEKMSDVIFNGTRKRKEAGLAQVTLVFDNNKGLLPTEYQQVSISRLLYRSGESEYRLNNVPCRLKDVQSLFLDTGIGSNSYAIIALGMVDDILSDKENARRRMFEQAAGISKYKKRKKETLSRLKSTAADLDRVEDLLYEIEGNLKSLEKQARRTKKYFELKDQYKELAVQHALHTVHLHKARYKELESALTQHQDAYRRLETTITTSESEIEAVKASNIAAEEQLSSRQKELAAMVNQIRSLESDKALTEQQIGFNQQTVANVQKEAVTADAELVATQVHLRAQQQRITVESTAADKLETERATAEEAYQTAKLTYQKAKDISDKVAQELNEIDRQIYLAEKDIAVLHNTIDNHKQTSQQINDRLESRKQQYDQLAGELLQAGEHRKLIAAKVEEAEQLLADRDTKMEQYRSHLVETKEAYDTVSRRLDSATNEHDLLKSMIDSLEGFPESIKFLSKQWKNKAPILSDILDVEESYKAVIEQYLESYLNYYIVRDVGEAAVAIRLLTSAQMGKAHFFLLDELKDLQGTDVVIANSVPAISVVHCEPTYLPLLQYLLADAYILEGSLDDFKYLDTYQHCDFLSASGTFVKRSHAISGGSVGLFEGKKIGRKKNLDKLDKRIASLDKERLQLKAKIGDIDQRLQEIKSDNPQQDLRRYQTELNTLDKDIIRLSLRSEEYQAFKASAGVQLADMASSMETSLATVARHKRAIADYKLAREAKVHAPGQNDLDIDQLSAAMSQASEHYNASNVAMIRHANLVETLRKDYAYQQTKAEELQASIAQLQQQERRLLDQTTAKQQDLDNITVKLLALYDDRKAHDTALSTAEQDFFAIRNTITDLESQLKVWHRDRNQMQAKVQQVRDDFNSVKFQINALGDRLKIEFEINLNDIINEEPDTTTTTEQLAERVDKLKKRLSTYGEINPMALETYEEMKLRYDDITVQRDDITEAKASLLQTIQEIETTATAKYLEAFEAVRLNFIEVFRSLFTEEDNCNLVLEDPANPLDSNIDIIAKPKGKKPVSLSQLSGGEKTLTATALLFALYLLKPAPFCIFDEVDAPLDDANIQKFNKIIKKFSKDSQFIIVTHNKSTMAAVDVLYGVYMQEQGVSGVSAVDFRNYDHVEQLEQVG